MCVHTHPHTQKNLRKLNPNQFGLVNKVNSSGEGREEGRKEGREGGREKGRGKEI